jgi:mono/diheme cytochrome c family protein
MDRIPRTSLHLAAATALAVATAAGVAACGPSGADCLLGEVCGAGGGGGGGGNNGGWGNGGGGGVYGTDGGAQQAMAEKLFRAIEPELKSKCGGCHGTGGAAPQALWLAGPDSYVTIKAYNGIITEDPYASKLLKHPDGHPASSLGLGNEMLRDKAIQWLNVEALNLQGTPLPTTEVVDPAGGSIPLDKAGMGMAGGKITFTATTMVDSLRLGNVQIQAPPTSAIHVVSPLFVMVPSQGAEVTDTSFSTSDVTVPAGQTLQLAPVYYIFNWQAGAKMRVAFQKIETTTVVPMDAGTTTCKALADFQNTVVPQWNALNCRSCHGGGNGGATGALDMTALGGTPNYALACTQARNKINFTNKAQSPIIVRPKQGTGHPYSVPAGNVAAYDTAMLTWINKE